MAEEPVDINEARRRRRGRSAIRSAIADAPTAAPKAADAAARGGGDRLEMNAHGLFKHERDKMPQLVCDFFEVLAETYDPDEKCWGLMLRFRDRDLREIQVVATRDQFAGESLELVRTLSRRGLAVRPGRIAANLLNEYLALQRPRGRARIVSRTGWHVVDGVRVFVLPEETTGDAPVQVIHQSALRGASPFSAAGDLAAWRDTIAVKAVGNSRLMLSISAAFAGPLLDLLGEDGGIVHLRGEAKSGKTMCLRAAASVWGYAGSGSRSSFLRTWRATAVGLEETAALHSDTFLPLDELGGAEAKDIGDAVYFLSSGQGRIRGGKAGGLRETAYFHLMAMSTGELSLAEKMGEASRRMRAGQEIRLLEIEAPVHKLTGVFEDLHGEKSLETFSAGLLAATGRNYGVAGPIFVERLTKLIAADGNYVRTLAREIGEMARGWLARYPDAGGQVANAARRFALIGAAGGLASMLELTDWPPLAAAWAAETCFLVWLAGRGFVGAREDHQAVTQLRTFLQAHGKSRFEVWAEAGARQAEAESPDNLPGDRQLVHNRAGWRRWELVDEGGGAKVGAVWRYYLVAGGGDPPTGMRAALSGLDYAQALRVLVQRGYIEAGPDGKASRSLRVPGHGIQRLYVVSPALFRDEAD